MRYERLKLQHIMTIFGLPTKSLENMLKRRRMMLFVGRWEGASATIAVCYDRRARSVPAIRYERSMFGQSDVSIYYAPYKIARKYAETASHVVELRTAGRGEFDGLDVL